MATRRMRPDRVSRYFARFRLASPVVPVDHLDAPAMRSSRDFTGSKKLLSARYGIRPWSTSTTPPAARVGIDHRSSELLRQQPSSLVRDAELGLELDCDMPLECVAIRCAAQNHTVSGNLDRCIAVPAVIDVADRSQGIRSVRPLFNNAARVPPQAGQTNPCGQRRSNKNARNSSRRKLV